MSRKDKKKPKLPVNDKGEVDFSPQRKFIVKRTGKQIARMQRMIKRTSIIVLILVLLALLLYFLFYFIDRGNSGSGEVIDKGDFTIQIDKGTRSFISLSEHEDLSEPTLLLQGTSVEDLWHCTRSWIPSDIDAVSKGGDNSNIGSGTKENPSYLCYTFYVINSSDGEVTYRYDLDFVEKYLDMDNAVRIMIFRNGESKVYAKKPIDATPLEPDTFTFVSEVTYVSERDLKIEKGKADKYTVVMWLEGEDPECIDDLLTGKLKVEMNFYTTDSANY